MTDRNNQEYSSSEGEFDRDCNIRGTEDFNLEDLNVQITLKPRSNNQSSQNNGGEKSNNPFAIGNSDQSYGEQINDQNTEREYTNRIVDLESFMNN